MGNVTDVTDATFDALVVKSDKPVLIDYWADWCAPCRQLSPIIEELAGEYSDKVTFLKMDTNANTACLLYTSPSPRDGLLSRMPSSA